MHEDLIRISVSDEEALHQNACTPATAASKKAAVLIPLVLHEKQWQVLYIRRARNERDRHSGQVAFPGGRLEPADAGPREAALRETTEEIGVQSPQIQVVGQLDPYVTVSAYEVTPVIGVMNWPSRLTLQTSEVARAFLIPVTWLRDRNNFTYRARRNVDPKNARRHPIVVFEEYDGEVLWGATARMTLNFLKAIDEGRVALPDA